MEEFSNSRVRKIKNQIKELIILEGSQGKQVQLVKNKLVELKSKRIKFLYRITNMDVDLGRNMNHEAQN